MWCLWPERLAWKIWIHLLAGAATDWPKEHKEFYEPSGLNLRLQNNAENDNSVPTLTGDVRIKLLKAPVPKQCSFSTASCRFTYLSFSQTLRSSYYNYLYLRDEETEPWRSYEALAKVSLTQYMAKRRLGSHLRPGASWRTQILATHPSPVFFSLPGNLKSWKEWNVVLVTGKKDESLSSRSSIEPNTSRAEEIPVDRFNTSSRW